MTIPFDWPAGRLLVLEPALEHDGETVVDSAFLLALGWRTEPR